MASEASERAFSDVGEVIAANLHRLRTARRMSLATLAARADVAKATLANLEQGRGNPTIETLWSLALGLGVAFSDLLEDQRETTSVVVRAQQGAAGPGYLVIVEQSRDFSRAQAGPGPFVPADLGR